MKIIEIIEVLEKIAPLHYQETYDNAGLITGNADWYCTGAICTLDATEAVIMEAKEKGCNLIVAHHPIVFGGLKKITGKNYVERAVIAAIKNDIAIYAIHTNLDNVKQGVNNRIADKLGLVNRNVLYPKHGQLMKLYTFIPLPFVEKVRSAVFEVGAGNIGNYSELSFNTVGKGTFKAGDFANPFVGEIGKRHEQDEIKTEIIFPAFMQKKIVEALLIVHPYEEVAYDILPLANENNAIGSGMIGELPNAISDTKFLEHLKNSFHLSIIKHTELLNKTVKKVAFCGGAGSFLIERAVAAGADFYITSDLKYHEFFDAEGALVIADIGHWESEQFTIDLLFDILKLKFPTFALLKTEINTNPVNYF